MRFFFLLLFFSPHKSHMGTSMEEREYTLDFSSELSWDVPIVLHSRYLAIYYWYRLRSLVFSPLSLASLFISHDVFIIIDRSPCCCLHSDKWLFCLLLFHSRLVNHIVRCFTFFLFFPDESRSGFSTWLSSSLSDDFIWGWSSFDSALLK